ncbi:MAG: hypothetical protein NC489_26430 [Ruminococcus flavefaciens]|nr:hypothetical protein [Roseburia sp.]MCM1233667.1 hypothetical protein [Ruminococcus flavefaciens]
MKKIIKNSIIALFNPVSPAITLVIGWLLTILVTEPNAAFPDFINYMINNPIAIMIFILFWLVFSVIYTEQREHITKLCETIRIKDEVIKEKETQLNHTAGIVLNRSGEFARFNKLLRFDDALTGFVQNNILVESAQIYTYSIKRIKRDVIIKVSYEAGYVYDNIDINNLAQTYYELEYIDYNQLKDIVNMWKELLTNTITSVREKDALIETVVKGIESLFKKYYLELQGLEDISSINNKHFTKYRILTLLIRLARRYSTTTIDNKNILGEEKKEIEYYLLNGKRTGILSSILLEDTFMFKYTRNSHKKDGRAYVCFPANISKQNYIIVFSIQTFDLDEYIDLEQEIDSLKSDFVNRLK